MNYQELKTYCLKKPGAFEDYPFGDDILVIKLGGKIFAILSGTDMAPKISLKCNPILALGLRDSYPAVQPGYHLNKQHWNTVTADGSIPPGEIREMIDHSYDLIFKSLPKGERERIRQG